MRSSYEFFFITLISASPYMSDVSVNSKHTCLVIVNTAVKDCEINDL